MMILCETDAWRKRKKEKSSRVEKILIATFLSKIKTNKEESMTCFIIFFCILLSLNMKGKYAQLFGRLFSPSIYTLYSGKNKKLSHYFLFHFPIGMGSYWFLWPPRKISGGVYGPQIKHFFHKGPPFGWRKFKWIQRGGTYEKSVL